ncbi:MAG: polyribonucleotide nucleotidyltransferase [Pseudomonadota bacterium]|nr:polyribonucleotide nucleotidyltransferase [Pseudomonadota bacterium]
MSMFEIHKKAIEWGGKTLTIETGKVARQANGAVVVTYGETSVLCTAVGEKKAKEGVNFFPLTVNYQEKAFAAGKIPGGFFKREGRPSEKETLVSRLIDRPIRPLFHERYKNETQVICTVLSHDLENDPDIISIIGASAALTISGIPFLGPLGAARVGYIKDSFVLNPSMEQLEESELDLVVAGTEEGVLMVESQANQLSEEIMLESVNFGHQQMRPVINAIIELAELCAKEPFELDEPPEEYNIVEEKLSRFADEFKNAYKINVKQERQQAISEIKSKAIDTLDDNETEVSIADSVLKNMEKDIVRKSILETGKRIDERSTSDVRPIEVEVGLLARAHGSALFTRGETQALVTTTLGTGQDEQIIDALEGEYRENFMLHYNFPPYSVGEAGRMGGTGRREIGHGKLAWRALKPLLPSKDNFPYTVRVVSEITESNGSSSMATVCGASLALMDAGVPIQNPVAGIAMGLIKDGDDFAVLSDILGDEDHLGDMDFKVAGTEFGITSLQMDIKITSITSEIMKIALNQAKGGRQHILNEMKSGISTPRENVSGNAPRITTINIPKDKIRDVIGTGGKSIREIQEETGCKIDIEDDGTVNVASSSQEATDDAVKRIKDIIAEPEVGLIYTGKVVKIMDFGAFVNFLGKRDGLVHISEIAENRIEKVTDVLSEGNLVKVKCLAIDDRGKVKLSMKKVNQETGEEIIKN